VAARRARLTVTEHRTRALVLRVVPFGEADAVVTLLGETTGRVAAMARGGRKASGTRPAIEPIHTLLVTLAEKPAAELMTLRASELDTVRTRLTARLDALDAAGRALRWVRAAMPPRHPDAAVWEVTSSLLDALDAPALAAPAVALLAAGGLRLLSALGWGLDLDACVRCGKPCPETNAGLLDPSRGGLVCRSCGGASSLVRPILRARVKAAQAGAGVLDAAEAGSVLGWVEAALLAHAGVVS
jgi:DNA repair protein RecO (recombination protein O)